jgi:tetratricopeptide (TPR) repeat protein
MPIRKSVSAASQRVARQSALKLFTDRTHERELLRHFFERLARVHRVHDVRPEKPILSIWGVGGIGKTKLLEKATEELGQRLGGLRLISLDLDHDRWTPSSSVGEFFWHLRSRLWEAKPRGLKGGAGIETPLFDYLYFALWRAQHPGENFALSDSVLKDLLSTSTLGTTILAEASGKLAAGVYDVATAGSAVGGLVQLLGKALTYLRNRDRKGLLNKRGLNPEFMTEKDMEAELALVLAADVEQWLEDHPNDALCVAIDGFERIQSTVLAEDIQKYLADWCGILTDPDGPFSGRFGCVLLGRNKNRWDELFDPEWQTRISEHRVGGLGKEDALRFLESAATYHKECGDLITANNLQKHAEAILAVTREQRSQDRRSSFHPYYLDLAYGIIYEQGAHFQPAQLGQTPAELQIRFLRYLQTAQREVFETFRCLALAGTFDEALFDHLVEIRLIPAGFHFAALTGEDYSYVEEIRDVPGTFRFHRLMELALIKNQSAKAEDRPVARQRIDVILDYFKKNAGFSKLAECSPQHLSAYQKGMTIAFDRHHDRLLDLPSLDSFFTALEKPFDFTAFVSARIDWWRKLADLWKHRQPEGERSLDTLSGLAAMLHAKGRYGEAENVQRQILQSSERVLGSDHPDTLSAMNNLAQTLYAQGHLAKSYELQEQVVEAMTRLMGKEHPDTLSAMDNLAQTLKAQGRLARAHELQEQVFEARTRLQGKEHPDTLSAMNNLAQTLKAQGDLARAHQLQEQVFEARVRLQGKEHPDTLVSMNNLAQTLKAQEDLAGAHELQERVVEAMARLQGTEHPSTLTSMNNLAQTLYAQGDLVGARKLQEQVLEARVRLLGNEHPNTLTSMNNLAQMLQAEGDFTGAERLYQQASERGEER